MGRRILRGVALTVVMLLLGFGFLTWAATDNEDEKRRRAAHDVELAKQLDGKIGESFPNLKLRELRSGKRMSLYDFPGEDIVVLFTRAACPFTFIDTDYYRDRGWTSRDGRAVVFVVLHMRRSERGDFWKRVGKNAPIYIVRDQESALLWQHNKTVH